MRRGYRLLAGVALVAATFGPALAGKPVIGKWGFDTDGMDPSVQPGDDFFRYATGTWMKKTEIPADRTRWGTFDRLRANAESDVRDLIVDVSTHPQAPGSTEQKVSDYYTSYIDTKKIEQLGLTPFKADLDRIAGLKTYEDAAALIADPGLGLNAPILIGFFYKTDDKHPDQYAVDILQAGLSLPDRDYYLKNDKNFVDTRTAFRTYVQKILELAHDPSPAANAQAILDLETRIAQNQWSIEKQRDRDAAYKPKTIAELKAYAPDYPWDAALTKGGLQHQGVFIVRTDEPIKALAKLFRATPLSLWRTYLTFQYLNAQADIMPAAFDQASFAFNGKVLNGQQQELERWARAVRSLSGQLGDQPLAEAVGSLYVKRHFSPEAKARVLEIVHNLLAAYKAEIAKLDWMSPETRKAAMRKAEAVRIKIGYPDKWRDYSNLDVKPDDAYGNRRRAAEWDWKRQLSRLGNKADKSEWSMGPQIVNAYYGANWNEIVFPAAILQPPFFDINADPAVNYGGIGNSIGHEMSHGYDDQGAKSDENGVLRSWWRKDDEDRFKTKTAALAEQFSSYEPLPGVHINGVNTSGENIGDLGGLTVCYQAYRLSLKGKEAPVLDGFTGDQRFFLAYAQDWRGIYRDDALRVRLLSDVHSPFEYRVNGIVRNVDAWYSAFGVKPGQKLYLPPKGRVHIW